MIRWLGALLLCAGSSALGFAAAARLKGRVRELESLEMGLRAMRRGLDSGMEPLDGMLRLAAQSASGRGRDLFRFCAEKISALEGQPFSALWEAGLAAACLPLEPGELDVLRQLGGVLGRYDAASQSAALERAAARLEELTARASERRGRLGRVYGTMGVCGGLFLAILLW